jgi:hypothetical protein
MGEHIGDTGGDTGEPEIGEPETGTRLDPELGRQPVWAQGTVAWPIALFAGFLGCWIGLQTQWTGFASVLAAVAFAPLFIVLLNRRGPVLAGVVSLAWAAGIAGALIGAVMEGQSELVRSHLPFPDLYRLSRIQGLEAAHSPGADAVVSGQPPWWLPLCWCVTTLALARATRGLLALVSSAFALAVVESGAGESVLRALERGANPVVAILLCTSPFAVLELAGVLLASAALAQHGLPAPPDVRQQRRRLLGAGLALAGGGWIASLALAPAWWRWLEEWLAG